MFLLISIFLYVEFVYVFNRVILGSVLGLFARYVVTIPDSRLLRHEQPEFFYDAVQSAFPLLLEMEREREKENVEERERERDKE